MYYYFHTEIFLFRLPMVLILLWVSRPKSLENSMKSANNEWKTKFWAFGIVWQDDWCGPSSQLEKKCPYNKKCTKNVSTTKCQISPVIFFTKMSSVMTVPWIWPMMDWRICASSWRHFYFLHTLTVLIQQRRPIDFKRDAEKWEKSWNRNQIKNHLK